MSSYPYDVKFTIDPGGENLEYGFMLLTPNNATKQLVSTEAPPSTMGRGEGADVLRASYEPSYAQSVAQIDWSGGMGQPELDTGEENMYSVGVGVVTHTLGKVYPALDSVGVLSVGSAGPIRGIRSYVSNTGTRMDFLWAGSGLFRRDPGGLGNWSLIYNAPSQITDFVIFNGVGVVAIGDSNSASDDFITLTSPFGTPTPTVRNHSAFTATEKPYYWQVVRNTLYALVNQNKVFMTVDPTQDSWVGPISITVGSITSPGAGDSTFRFTSSVSLNDYLLVFKENAGYGIDSEQNVVEVIWQFASRPSPDNFRWVVPGGEYCFYTAANDVWVYDPRSGANFPIGISRMHSVSVSRLLGLSSDSQHVYTLAELSPRHIDGVTYVGLIRSTRVSGLRYAHELIWASDTLQSVDVYGVWTLPRDSTSNSVYVCFRSGSDSTMLLFHYPTSWDESGVPGQRINGRLYTSEITSKLPTFVKRYLWLGVSAEGASSTSYIDVDIRIDNGPWVYVGRVDSSYKIFTLSNLIGRVAQLRFSFFPSATSCPVLRAWDLHARPRYRYLPVKELYVRVADNIELNNGTRDSRSMEEIFSQLRELRTSEKKILYEDFTGESFLCSIDKLNFQPSLHEVPDSNIEMVAVLSVARSDEGE